MAEQSNYRLPNGEDTDNPKWAVAMWMEAYDDLVGRIMMAVQELKDQGNPGLAAYVEDLLDE
jgi:hypothetical protein